jgi:hypothetical protein
MVETVLVKWVMNQYIIRATILMNVKQIHAAHIQIAPTIRDHTTVLVCPLSIVNTMREIVLARRDIKSKTVNAKISTNVSQIHVVLSPTALTYQDLIIALVSMAILDITASTALISMTVHRSRVTVMQHVTTWRAHTNANATVAGLEMERAKMAVKRCGQHAQTQPAQQTPTVWTNLQAVSVYALQALNCATEPAFLYPPSLSR